MLKEGSITMELPKRRSIRLPDYDYTQNGAYFITLCTHEQQRLFGYVEEEKMFLNDAGKMLLVWLNKLSEKYPKVSLDTYIVMPDHIHFILFFENNDRALGEILRWFKTQSTNEYMRGVKIGLFSPFQKRIWQRNYYEHIIRNESDLLEVRNYIQHNAAKYQLKQNK